MNETANRIAVLIGKHLKQELSEEETQELNAWIQESGDHREIFEQLTDVDYLEYTVREKYRTKPVEATREKLNLLIETDGEINQRNGKIHKIWPRLAVAAAVLCLLAISAVYILRKSNQPKMAVAKERKEKQDISPGVNKATLTLADGRSIVLDSSTIGQLVQQGSTNVLNKEGQLVYTPTAGVRQGETLYNTLTTAKGQTYETVLSDGTKVWLNSQSSIRYPVTFNSELRNVEITGEAYLEVAPLLSNRQKGKRPFIVNVGGIEVEVLGTHFNVNSYANEESIKTTLLEGKVRVGQKNNGSQTVLIPGEQAKFNKRTNVLSKTKDVEVEAEVAWRYGFFQFINADLKTVMRQLERWYDVEVQYKGKVPDREFVGKIPRNLNLSKVLILLQKQNVHFKIEGNKIVVTP